MVDLVFEHSISLLVYVTNWPAFLRLFSLWSAEGD
jgi:hypothetical protein